MRAKTNRSVLYWAIGVSLGALAAVAGNARAGEPLGPGNQPTAAPTGDVAGTTDTGSAGADTGKQKPLTLQKVVVVAQKRAQDEQKVPLAVTAINEAELDRRGITNIGDLSAVAPGLLVTAAPGVSSSALISIRGQAQPNPEPYWDTPVGVYLDGVYVSKAEGSVFDLPLAHVEVLNGPQGTLYGRNTFAGAINLITPTPTGQFDGQASLGLGNYGAANAKFMMDLPAAVAGRLKVLVAGQVQRRDGWVDTTPGSVVPQLNNVHTNYFFANATYAITNQLSASYVLDHSNLNQFGAYSQTLASNIEDAFGIPGIDAISGRQTTAAIGSLDAERSKVDGNALTLTWHLDDKNELKYIVSHRVLHWDNWAPFGFSPVAIAQTFEFDRYHDNTQELNYIGSAGNWNWVAGAYWFQDKGFSDEPENFFFGASTIQNQYSFGTKSRALFGQATYHVSNRLSASVGVRRTISKKDMTDYYAANGFVLIPHGSYAWTSASDTSPMASVQYQLRQNNMVYFRWAKGFQEGGLNGQSTSLVAFLTPYLPQTSRTYELGSKSTLLDGRAVLNADVYNTLSSNLQETVFTPTSASTGTIVQNVGSSRGRGLELSGALRATGDLTLRMNYSYSHVKFRKFLVGGINVADNRAVPYAPHNTFNFTLDDVLGRFPIGVLSTSADFRYTSGFYAILSQFQDTDPNVLLAKDTRVKPLGTLNWRLALSGMDWGGVSGEVSLWVENLTNRAHVGTLVDFGDDFGGLITGNYNDPRMFGVTVKVSW